MDSNSWHFGAASWPPAVGSLTSSTVKSIRNQLTLLFLAFIFQIDVRPKTINAPPTGCKKAQH